MGTKSPKCSCGSKKFVSIDCRPMFGDSNLSLVDGKKTVDVDFDDEDTEIPEEIEKFVHVSWSGMSVEVSLTICTECRKVQ